MEHDPFVRNHCATKYLNDLKAAMGKMDSIREDIELLRDVGTATMDYHEHVSSSPNPKKFEDRMLRLREKEDKWDEELKEFLEKIDVAHDVFLSMRNRDGARALKLHYMRGKTWEMTCVEMGYSYGGMMKLRRRAVDEVYDLMPEEWRRQPIPNAAA